MLRAAGNRFVPQRGVASPRATNQNPACEQPLTQFEFDRLRGVRLDRCKASGGIWLDHREASESARLAPARPPPSPSPRSPAAADSSSPTSRARRRRARRSWPGSRQIGAGSTAPPGRGRHRGSRRARALSLASTEAWSITPAALAP
ncbi:MAG TPA: hypothetical protein DFS52_04285 [Myxococcales bacterium]|nr:hypothetical protein [Myxococcales bacterium]